jgi:hypothetical protein
MPDLPLSDFGVDALTQATIRALKQVAWAENTSAITMYNNEIAKIKGQNEWFSGNGLPTIPQPPPPMIKIVNEDLVKQLEANFGQKPGQTLDESADWGNVFFLVQYVPIIPPVIGPAPVVIGGPSIGYPGFFDTISGDGPAIPIGYVQPQGGHSYRKTIIGDSPFAPNGHVTKFQQIS